MNLPGRQSRFERGDDVVVLKFGGTSVEDIGAIRRLIGIVRSRLDARPVIVVSALAGVTDQLLEAGRAAGSGRLGAALATVRDIYVRHEELADSLVEGSAHSALDRELRGEFRALESLLLDFESSRQFNGKLLDQLLGFGESFSSRLVTEALSQAGLAAAHVDARSCIVTDLRHGQATPLWDECNDRIQDALSPLLQSDRVPVLGGFIASTLDGEPTTLGRGGSDFSAAIIGAALCASRIEIWTDVDGIMTADPKLCSDARMIRRMNFDEAEELARCGAKVLHPATLAPARRQNIPVWVLNSRRPEGEGTEISSRARSGDGTSAIVAKRNVTAIEIEAPQAVDSELLGAVFAIFEQHSCLVEVIATSFGRISLLATPAPDLSAIAENLRGLAKVRWQNHKALVSLVGETVRREPGFSSRAFAAVSDMEPSVVGQGASQPIIALLVDESRVEEVVQRLHALLFAKPENPPDWGGVSVAYGQAGFSPRRELPGKRGDESVPA
jgi:aspartate kinase